MTEFRFYYGLNLAFTVYSLTDNLSKTLQKENLSAAEGKSIAMKTVETFEKMRDETSADLFFDSVQKKASKLEFIEDPVLPRKRKNPNYKMMTNSFQVQGYSEGSQPYHPATAKEHYRGIYFEVLDVMINSLKEWYNQSSFLIFDSIESLLLECINTPEKISQKHEDSITELYGDEIDLMSFKVESNVLRTIIDGEVTCFKEIYEKVKACCKGERELMPNIVHAIRLLLVNPATSCTPERSFSTSRRLKTWLRSTMTSKRFNTLAFLNIHKDLTDELNLKDVGKEFVSAREGRQGYFGKFV